jgi:diketogulonate reductase-like aldo/keto reductase
MSTPLSRRDFLRLGTGAALAVACGVRADAQGAPMPLATSTIPSTGEKLPRLGLGTWQTFDVGPDAAARAQLAEVLREFVAAGAKLVDTSPMYGRAEQTLGDLTAEAGVRDRLFVATKVWTSGRAAGVAQMEESLRRLRTAQVELMQIHNLVDWRTHLATLREWKERGRTRLIGVTHYTSGALDDLARVVRSEPVDFVQYALSLDETEAAPDFLRLCADRGVAFIANRPFGGGGALARVRGKPLPAFAAELGITSWAQFLLKWVLSHPEVTCAIPGTSRPQHLRDNLQAARGPMPDAAQRAKMAAAWRDA